MVAKYDRRRFWSTLSRARGSGARLFVCRPQPYRRSNLKAIPDATHGEQVARLGRIELELRPQLREKIVDGALRSVVPRSPYPALYLLARAHVARGFDQVPEDLELRRSERHRRSGLRDLPGRRVD